MERSKRPSVIKFTEHMYVFANILLVFQLKNSLSFSIITITTIKLTIVLGLGCLLD